MKLALFMILVLSVLAGCTTRVADFSIISTKNFDLSHAANLQRGATRVEGSDKISIIVLIPIGAPNMEKAIDRALQTIPGAVALVDGVLYWKGWYIPYIYGESKYVVEGTPLIDSSIGATESESAYLVGTLDYNGAVEELRPVTKSEYDAVKHEADPAE